MKNEWKSDCCEEEVEENRLGMYLCVGCGQVCDAVRVFIKGGDK